MIHKLHLNRSELETLKELVDGNEKSAVIAEKINLLLSYVVLIEESIKAKNKAEYKKKVYFNYIKTKHNSSEHDDFDNLESLEVLTDPD